MSNFDTIFFNSIEEGNYAQVSSMLANNPKLAMFPDHMGNYPIHCAARANKADIVDLLLQAVPETAQLTTVSLAHREPYQAIHIAALHGATDAVRAILAHHPQAAHAVTPDGSLPIHLAVEYGDSPDHTDIVKLLLDANPNGARTPNGSGWLPIQIASEFGRNEMANAILDVAPDTVSVPGPTDAFTMQLTIETSKELIEKTLFQEPPQKKLHDVQVERALKIVGQGR